MVDSPKTISDLSLEKLKIMFDGRISTRRLGCVEQKYDLLKYLWKEDKIDPCYLEKYKNNNMEEISQHDDAFSRYLLNDNWCRCTSENEYAKERENDHIQLIAQSKSDTNESVKQFAKKKFKIHSLIRIEIGSKWREFGRHLEIREGTLDNIDCENKEVERKVDEVFKVFEKDHHAMFTYIDKVCSALIESRRKDLSKDVQNIMQRYL